MPAKMSAVDFSRKGRLAEIFRYRAFLWMSIQKEFKNRYKQSFMGLAWLIVEPLMLVITFSTVFWLLERKGPEGVPFPIYFYSGILGWQLFVAALNRGSAIFVSEKNMITKVNFPKELSVIKHHTVFFIDFCVASLAFLVILFFYGYHPTVHYFWIPVLLLLQIIFALGLSFLLSTYHVFLRDIGILTKALTSVWFWFTPVIFRYPYEGKTKIVYTLNPMAGVISGYHDIFAFQRAPNLHALTSIVIVSPLLLIWGYLSFRKHERHFVDVI